MNKETTAIINAIADAYIKVYGFEKWNGFTDQEKHDVIMTIVKDLNNRMGE